MISSQGFVASHFCAAIEVTHQHGWLRSNHIGVHIQRSQNILRVSGAARPDAENRKALRRDNINRDSRPAASESQRSRPATPCV
jgi:hypothetical protein